MKCQEGLEEVITREYPNSPNNNLPLYPRPTIYDRSLTCRVTAEQTAQMWFELLKQYTEKNVESNQLQQKKQHDAGARDLGVEPK